MTTWSADVALPGFESATLPLPAEDDGPLCATLVRRRGASGARRAVLYVHGFIDYFFQAHVADACVARGWDFYALDLRRFGRSMREGNRPNYITDLAHYDRELSMAIDLIRRDDAHDTLVLLGHSTGGLITSWYAHRGARRADVQGLVLNSPFFEFAIPSSQRLKLSIGTMLGAVWPQGADKTGISRWYGESLRSECHGEWDYDLRWKPLLGFPIHFGWVRAVRTVHARVAAGLDIGCPVLLMHAGASMMARGAWDDAYLANDIVLDIADMQAHGPTLGRDVTLRAFPGGIHDLFLSRASVREAALTTMLRWLDERVTATHAVAVHGDVHV